ncbi:OmpA family protein [Pseudomonadota bacterium]|nr:OmpA family protein [Pseudomonadota bacterium]
MKLFISYLILFFSSLALAEQFQAPLTNTQWQVIESPLECVLSQSIAGFGEAKFTQSNGEAFSLVYTTRSHPAVEGFSHFEIAEAPWQNIEQRLSLVVIPTKSNQMQFSIKGKLAKQALTHIEEGRFPTLRYRSYNEEISALFSTVHLNDSIPAFKQCLENLYPDSFDDIRKLTIYFALESSDLSSQAQASLTKIADYVKIDSNVKRINIDGYTDNHGRRRLNIELSEARALSIKNYLVTEHGIPENLITTAFHREFKPAKTNKTQKGRAYNRRSEIEVFR